MSHQLHALSVFHAGASHASRVPITHLTSGADWLSIGPTYTSFNIAAGGGNDTVQVSWGNDTVNGEGGNDYLYSPGGNDSLSGGDGNDTIVAGEGKDTLNGDGGNDLVQDFGGNATENGGSGDDTLQGTGRDTMIGGTGADTFGIIFTGRPIEVTDNDYKPIIDGDKLDLTGLGYWDQNGFHPIDETSLEVDGKDLVVHTAFEGDAIIHGVGAVIALIGIENAVNDGFIQLEAKG